MPFLRSDVQPFGKNIGSYRGETIEIPKVLTDIQTAAAQHGWTSETFFESNDLQLLALQRHSTAALLNVYISAGIHGDEPAGPLAASRLLQENQWPPNVNVWMCPCLNPIGFRLNCRANAKGIDLNREYLKPTSAEVVAHIAWLQRQPAFDLCLLLHEDWESHGFYLYEQNLDNKPSLAPAMLRAVEKVCPIDRSDLIEGRPAKDGVVRPNIQPHERSDWPEAFYVITHKTRLSYTLEAPSDFPLESRVAALTFAVRAALKRLH